jgi:hypothetical protein
MAHPGCAVFYQVFPVSGEGALLRESFLGTGEFS